MCDDFQSAGIDAFMDITKGDSATDFDTALPEWIRVSDFVVLVGSTLCHQIKRSFYTHLH
jgi:hypothetical protein